MSRVHNFGAGPAALPLPVLERVRDELVEFDGTGMSIMEHSHRGKAYDAVHRAAMELFHEVLGLPRDFKVLFMQGGASTQFLAVPMNLIPEGGSADYVLTGNWAQKAIKQAQGVARGRVAATSEASNFDRVPTDFDWDTGAAYAHVTSNNTIYGTQWPELPAVTDRTAVVDMSSDIVSRPVDFTHLDLVYAGAQKNLGPSGVTVVLIRESLLERCNDVPPMLSYKTMAAKESLYNTPPTFAIYIVKCVLEWVRDEGGLAEIHRRNQEKAGLLYAALDAAPEFFRGTAQPESRSAMNATFRLPSEELEKKLVSEATAAGFIGLKGHRDVGGLRASMYNAVSVESVTALVDFMHAFAEANG